MKKAIVSLLSIFMLLESMSLYACGPMGHDVVAALERITDALTNHYSELTDSMKVDYLKMIVHMVGDLHCPMHAGRRTDRGGNGVLRMILST